MCEYCNCQAIPAIEILQREHDQAIDHIHTAIKALHDGDAGQVQNTCWQLIALLGPHGAVEEQALFLALQRDFPDQMVDLCHEHEIVDVALAEATRSGGRGPGWEQRLESALRLLREHIVKEQEGVFPAALSTLTNADWEELDRVRERATAQAAAALPTSAMPVASIVTG